VRIVLEGLESEAAIIFRGPLVQRIDDQPNAGSLFDRRAGGKIPVFAE
jgi:hypothetical protein